jgi:hypothetical protein
MTNEMGTPSPIVTADAMPPYFLQVLKPELPCARSAWSSDHRQRMAVRWRRRTDESHPRVSPSSPCDSDKQQDKK